MLISLKFAHIFYKSNDGILRKILITLSIAGAWSSAVWILFTPTTYSVTGILGVISFVPAVITLVVSYYILTKL